MNVPALLVRLYPPAIRDRWGPEIVSEAHRAGPRAWFDTAAGATKLWLRPSAWPETAAGQTGRVVATAAVAAATTAALLFRAVAPPLTADAGHPITSAWLVPIAAGLALATPLPPLSRTAFGRLARTAARTLAPAVCAVLALFLVARSGLAEHPTGPVRVLLLGYYWATLGFAGMSLCRLVARAGRIAIVPGTRRLRHALLLIGAGLGIAAGQALTTSLQAGPVVLGCGLAGLAALVLTAGLDLRHHGH